MGVFRLKSIFTVGKYCGNILNFWQVFKICNYFQPWLFHKLHCVILYDGCFLVVQSSRGGAAEEEDTTLGDQGVVPGQIERFFQVRGIFNLSTEHITAGLKGDKSFSFCFSHGDHTCPDLCSGLLRHHHQQGGHDGLVHGAPSGPDSAPGRERALQEEPVRCLK